MSTGARAVMLQRRRRPPAWGPPPLALRGPLVPRRDAICAPAGRAGPTPRIKCQPRTRRGLLPGPLAGCLLGLQYLFVASRALHVQWVGSRLCERRRGLGAGRDHDDAHHAGVKDHFIVSGPDVEPMKFKTRVEARDWCRTHHPGSPITEVGPGGKPAPRKKTGAWSGRDG
jgi:hypothetical protein